MARTKRGIPYKRYWGNTKEETKKRWLDSLEEPPSRWGWKPDHWKREYLLHGTDARNYSHNTHYYFNRANRIGRRVARDQLRPHIVLGGDFDFDDSHYRARYKGVWWDIY